MTRLPSRTRVLGSLSALALSLLAVVTLAPAVASADEDKRAEYGTVIGIGASRACLLCLLPSSLRFFLNLDLGTT